MRTTKRLIRIRDKHILEDYPKLDIDFIEILLPTNEVDNFINKYASSFFLRQQKDSPEQVEKRDRQHQELRDSMYKAASECLTNRQFQIFFLRFRGRMKEKDIATKLRVNQPYVSHVSAVCIEKLKRKLGFPSTMRKRQFYKLKEIEATRKASKSMVVRTNRDKSPKKINKKRQSIRNRRKRKKK